MVEGGCTATRRREDLVAEDTQHQALYRRYRPQTPAELIGQDHVVRALTGSIREDRLHHGFLF